MTEDMDQEQKVVGANLVFPEDDPDPYSTAISVIVATIKYAEERQGGMNEVEFSTLLNIKKVILEDDPDIAAELL